MIRISAALWLLLNLLAAGTTPAAAQSGCSSIAAGAVLTAAQWNACFQAKVNFPIPAGVLSGTEPITITNGNVVGFDYAHAGAFTAAQSIAGLTVTSSFTATGLVTNADLVNSSVIINGVSCTLGSSCAGITATATSITPGTTSVVTPVPWGVLFADGSSPTSFVQDNGNFFAYPNIGGSTSALAYNPTGVAQASLPILGGSGSGFYAFGVNPWVQLVGVGNHNGWGGLSFGGAYNGGSGFVPTGTFINDAMMNELIFGFDTIAWSLGAASQVVPTENWAPGHNGSQWQWCAVATGGTYGNSCFIMLLDSQAGLTITSAPFTLAIQGGDSWSHAAWTTTGLIIQEQGGSINDSTGTGTVANVYTRKWGGKTVTATGAVTYTNYYGSYFKADVAGTNVTMTYKWALGADSISDVGALLVGGSLTNPGIASAAQADVVCTTAAGLFSYQVSATGCASSTEDDKDILGYMGRDEVVRVALGLSEIKEWTYKKSLNFGDDSRYVGFTAQQVEKIDPRFVTYERGKLHAVKHQQLAEVAIAGFSILLRDLKADNDNLRAELRAATAR
jgi:hypothetical protein